MRRLEDPGHGVLQADRSIGQRRANVHGEVRVAIELDARQRAPPSATTEARDDLSRAHRATVGIAVDPDGLLRCVRPDGVDGLVGSLVIKLGPERRNRRARGADLEEPVDPRVRLDGYRDRTADQIAYRPIEFLARETPHAGRRREREWAPRTRVTG